MLGLLSGTSNEIFYPNVHLHLNLHLKWTLNFWKAHLNNRNIQSIQILGNFKAKSAQKVSKSGIGRSEVFAKCPEVVLMIFNLFLSLSLQIEECVVCSDKKASILFKPCGHMCACEGK